MTTMKAPPLLSGATEVAIQMVVNTQPPRLTQITRRKATMEEEEHRCFHKCKRNKTFKLYLIEANTRN